MIEAAMALWHPFSFQLLEVLTNGGNSMLAGFTEKWGLGYRF